jgi:hypothetical protein
MPPVLLPLASLLKRPSLQLAARDQAMYASAMWWGGHMVEMFEAQVVRDN